MKDLPPPVRAMFASGKVETVAKSLMTKNQLHIDQAAIVERELILLLLGLKNPAEFTQTLATEAMLSQATINSISQDVNTQIFMPIREEMKVGAALLAKAPQPKASPTPPAMNQPAGTMAPPPQSPRYFHLENKIPPPSNQAFRGSARTAPLPPKNVLPQQPAPKAATGGLRDALAAAMKTPAPRPSPQAPVSTAKPKLLEDHEEPHIELGAKLVPPPPLSTKPKIPPAPASYSSDPYREPIA